MRYFLFLAGAALLPLAAFANGADTHGMMWGGGFGMGFVTPLLFWVWLVVGVLAAIWLWKQIMKK